jgi:hypothetical protein
MMMLFYMGVKLISYSKARIRIKCWGKYVDPREEVIRE